MKLTQSLRKLGSRTNVGHNHGKHHDPQPRPLCDDPLRVRAADNVRSMEDITRLIQRDAVGRKPNSQDLTSITHVFSSMLRLLLHDFFVLLPFDERNLVVPSTGVEGGP